ncbi:MAG: hypothetical protein FWD71_14155 [Oscillospiraceae bacterium]|nr:hypothetical protein [Oscillospiraceae bacterium]
MKKFKIVIAVLLCLTMVFPVIACSKNNGGQTNNNTTNAAGNSSGVTSTTADPNQPDLPQTDMGGKTFTAFTAGWGGDTADSQILINDLVVESETGDPINDAAYERQAKIEQQYNCKLAQFNVADPNDAVTKLQTAILAGDATYDFAITTCTNFASLLTGSFLTDFSNLTYIDMDKPYWDKNFYDSMAIMGKHFAANGDISKRRLQCVWIMCFNKSMIVANNLESPYDLVTNGQWTFDKMDEMGRTVAKDLNGDGKMTLTDDLWGLNYTGDTIMGIINSCGAKIAELDSQGIPQITIGTQVNLDKMQKIYTEMRDSTFSIDTLFKVGGGLTGLTDTDIFADSRCLFLATATHQIPALRTMTVDFGIIPYPKWDAAQNNYIPCTAGDFYPVLSIPKTNADLDDTSIILEALSYEGKQSITPAYYDSLLKTKTARDEDSVAMIDDIFGNLSYDIGNMYNFGGILGTFGYNMSTNKSMNIVSTIDKSTGVWQKAIDDIITQINKGDG